MDIKDLKIIPPEGMEYYIENGEIRFREIKKNLTYNDIAKELFENNKTYYTDAFSNIKRANGAYDNYWQANNCTSEKQVKKLLAINKLINVAKYLNGDWQPDWNDGKQKKYYISIVINDIKIDFMFNNRCSDIYFKSKELTEQAINILGEESIKLALSTDW